MTIAANVVFLLVLIRLFSIDSWASGSPRLLTFVVAAASLWGGAYWIDGPRWLRLADYVTGHFVMLWGLTLQILASAEHNASLQTMGVTILYAVYAIGLISGGVATRTAVNRLSGLVLMAGVVLKLYLYDVWQLSRLYKTLAFVALGVLLLSTSFLYSRFRAMIESWWKSDETPV